jgi:asparagine synthase (glutamine-hydrolysing)
MCGIVAVVAPGDTLDRLTLDTMRDRIAHRGPDGRASWMAGTNAGRVGLGHRRLAIIDLSAAAAQPMFSPDGSVAIVYNGEIYNYVELRAELKSLGTAFTTRSDTEVLLAAYLRWGVDCLPRLNGMFAFALWDGRSNELFVARDRFGEKPLFRADIPGGGVAFASEIKALLAHPLLEARVDEATLAAYTGGRFYEDGPETMFRGIHRIPPAHAALVDATGRTTRQWRYWTPDYTAVRDDLSDQEIVTRFSELLTRSVEMRLRSDVPVGTSLSGGLDSSMLVCLIARSRDRSDVVTQNTFSGRYDDDPSISEGPEIDLVTKHANVNAYAVTPDPRRMVDEIERLHWHQEEPFLSASIYMQWCVMRLAQEHATTVLIDGQGADELLAGYQFYFRAHQLDLIDRRRPLELWQETRAFSNRLRRRSSGFPNGRRRFDARIAYSLPALAALSARTPSPFAGPYDVGVAPARPGMRLRRQVSESLLYNSLPMLLRYADRNGMAFSREGRLPFLDHELVDFCISLPDRSLVRQGWQKYVLREAGEGILPRAIQWRADKVGYAAPLDLWLRGPLKEWAYERLFSGSITGVEGYDAQALRGLWEAHQAATAEHSWALWRWISLGEWLGLLEGGAWRRGDRASDGSGDRLRQTRIIR